MYGSTRSLNDSQSGGTLKGSVEGGGHLGMPGKIFPTIDAATILAFRKPCSGASKRPLALTAVFMDIDSIEPGFDFVDVLKEQVDQCDILLTVIGPNWLDAEDEARQPQAGRCRRLCSHRD